MKTKVTITLLSLAFIFGASFAWDPKQAQAKNSTDWMKHHHKFLNITEEKHNSIKVVFIGASIMEFWQTNGKEVWQWYVNRSAVDYGIAGDTTANVLWRVENHELDTLKPRVVALQVGFNNFGFANNEEIAEAVAEVVKQIRAKCPETKIINIGILPIKDTKQESRVKSINQLLAKTEDNKHVFFLDLGPHMVDSAGHQKSELFNKDGVHPTLAGYEIWHQTMKPLFEKLYNE